MNKPSKRGGRYRPKKFWWQAAVHLVETKLRAYPSLHRAVFDYIMTPTYWALSSFRTRLEIFLNKTTNGIDIDKTVRISPARITYCSSLGFDIYSEKGKVIGGNWDGLEKKFENLDVFVALKKVLTQHTDWRNTVYYRRFVGQIKMGKTMWGCSNESEFQNRCKSLEALFEDIKNNGYKSQLELQQSERFWEPRMLEDEITVNIGRDGDLLFNDGAHRLAIAKILNINKIPVKITVRHTKWMLFREELLQYARNRRAGTLYQPLTHPDFEDIPASRYCEDRFTTIRDNMRSRTGRLLDIGANFGYFCHKFEDEGFECYAVENSPRELYFARKLRRAENKKFKIVGESIYEWPEVGKIYFDVILALSIFHHALKTRNTYYQLIELLGNLRAGEIFFEPPRENDPQMIGAYRSLSPSEFVKFVAHHSGLVKAEIIGKTAEDRELYRLSR